MDRGIFFSDTHEIVQESKTYGLNCEMGGIGWEHNVLPDDFLTNALFWRCELHHYARKSCSFVEFVLSAVITLCFERNLSV
jgi:hypothetical protein